MFHRARGLLHHVKRILCCFGVLGCGERTRTFIEVEGISDVLLHAAADSMDGLSAREISKLLLGLQARVYGSVDCRLNPSVLQSHMTSAIEHQKRKRELVEKAVVF